LRRLVGSRRSAADSLQTNSSPDEREARARLEWRGRRSEHVSEQLSIDADIEGSFWEWYCHLQREHNAMTDVRSLIMTVALCASLMPAAVVAQPVGKITGVGGVFFKSKNPKALMTWYRDVLGIKLEEWGGAALTYSAPNHPPAVIVNAFDQATDYMDPSKREFMINFAVDNLTAFLDRLKSKGVVVLKRDDTDPNGKFAWIIDPDGTKIELWEPVDETAPK
jgi:predicted enzyme related to lactoylglutathione lyase